MDNAIQGVHIIFIPFEMDNETHRIGFRPNQSPLVEDQSPPLSGSRQPNSATYQRSMANISHQRTETL